MSRRIRPPDKLPIGREPMVKVVERLKVPAAVLACVLLAWLAACGSRSESPGGWQATAPFVPSLAAAAPGTAIITVVVPPHPASTAKPAVVSPGTEGLGVTVTSTSGISTKFFYRLTPSAAYCTGGGSAVRLVCRLHAMVPAGTDTFAFDAFAGKSRNSPLLARGTTVRSIDAGTATAIDLTMGGVVSFLQAALEDPFPPKGKRSVVALRVTAADASGYEILGRYATPIAISDSDSSGATTLAQKRLESSDAASELMLTYSGAALQAPAVIRLATKSQSTSVTLDPGGTGIVAKPATLFTADNIGGTLVTLSGPGTRAPYTLSTARDPNGDPSCARLVSVEGFGSSFVVSASKKVGACWLTASDRDGHRGGIPILVSSSAWPRGPEPTPPPIPAASPGTVSTSGPVIQSSSVPLPLPSADFVIAHINVVPAPSQPVPPKTRVVSVLSDQAPAGVTPPFARHPFARGRYYYYYSSPIDYAVLTFDRDLSLADQPAMSFTLPSDQIVYGAQYWLALFDSTRPDLGWQLGFEGPGAVNYSTVSFGGYGSSSSSGYGYASPFYFAQYQPYYFALYALSVAAPTPTSPPTPTPLPPTPAPGVTPTPGFGVVPTFAFLSAPGQTQSIAASGTAPYSVFTSDQTVVTADPVYGAGPFTLTAQGYGFATVTLADADGNTAYVTVSVDSIAGTIGEYSVPTTASQPRNIALGSDGAMWFTETAAGNIGRIATDGTVTEYPVPTGGSAPWDIALGPDGALWFTENASDQIGQITTAGSVTEFPIPTSGAGLFGIARGPDGALWFTEPGANKIGRMTTAGSFTDFPITTSASNPLYIAPGPDGALWFTECAANKIGRITTAGSVTEYSIPTSGSAPQRIFPGPDGAMWFTELNGNNVGRVPTSGTIQIGEYPILTAASQPGGIATGADGALWFAEMAANQIGRLH